MNIRIFRLVDNSIVVAEELERTKDNVWVKNPSVMKMFQDKQGMKLQLVDFIPEFFADFEEQIKKFPLKKHFVVMEGKPKQEIKNIYGGYLEKLFRRLSNIKIVGGDALNKLPKDGRGEPILQ